DRAALGASEVAGRVDSPYFRRRSAPEAVCGHYNRELPPVQPIARRLISSTGRGGEQALRIRRLLEEVAAQDAQREDFLVNLRRGADTDTAHHRQRRIESRERVQHEE